MVGPSALAESTATATVAHVKPARALAGQSAGTGAATIAGTEVTGGAATVVVGAGVVGAADVGVGAVVLTGPVVVAAVGDFVDDHAASMRSIATLVAWRL